MTVSFVVHPVALVHVPRRMNQSTVAFAHAHVPHALVHAPIGVVYSAKSMFYELATA